MRRDPTEFRKRFELWKSGNQVYESGRPLPAYEGGKDNETVTNYVIPFIKDKAITLSNAGYATGARLSTNLLDTIADNALRAGLPLKTALGLAVKESTLGNPTDDRSMRTLLTKKHLLELSDYLEETYGLSYDQQFGLHINPGNYVLGLELVNYYRGNIENKPQYPLTTTRTDKKSIVQKAFEFYKENPDKYNPGQKNYLKLVDKCGEEVWKSPEILKWLKDKNTIDGGILPEVVVYPNNHPVRRGIVPSTGWMKLPQYRGGKNPIRIKWSYNDETGLVRKALPDIVVTGNKPKTSYMRPWKTIWEVRDEAMKDETLRRRQEQKALGLSDTQYDLYKSDLSKPLSPVDPVGEFVVSSVALNPVFKYLFGGIGGILKEGAYKVAGKIKPLRNILIKREMRNAINSGIVDTEPIAVHNGEFKQIGPLYNDDVTIFKLVGDGKFKRVKQNIHYETSDVPVNESFTYNGPVRNITGANINAAAMRGIKAKYEKTFDVPESVKTLFQKQVIPRRLRLYELGQQTSGVKKIQEYMSDYGDIDFSTPEGLRVANERGWTMLEVQDYMDYVDYSSKLNDVLDTKYYTHPRNIWDMLNPVKNDRQTTAAYDPIKDRIELPEDFKPSSLIHELRHRMQKLVPKTNTEKSILKNAYGQATKEVELEPVNTTVRNKLLERNGAQNASERVLNSVLNSDTFVSDDEILSTLSLDTAYGKDIVTAINSKLGDLRNSLSRAGYQGEDLDFMLNREKSKIVSQIREAMTSVGVLALPIVLRNLLNTNTENEL